MHSPPPAPPGDSVVVNDNAMGSKPIAHTMGYAARLGIVYGLVQWVPLFLLISTSPLTWGWVASPDWWGRLNRGLGYWVVVNLLRLPEHSPPRFGGNPLSLFVGMVVLALLSAAIAFAWWRADKHRPRPMLFAYSHVCLRYMLAMMMLWYGWHKVLPAQFPLTFDYFTLEVGQHSPRDLLWAFMGASREYQMFAGVVECTGGLLLLARRTALLGAAISAGAMGNVVAMNIGYDVGVKFLAAQMFLMALAAMAPFAGPLFNLFVMDRTASPSGVAGPIRSEAFRRAIRVAGVAVAGWFAVATFAGAQRQADANERATHTPLYGIWDVEEVTQDGDPVPLLWPNSSLWRRFVVQSTSAAVVIPLAHPTSENMTTPNARRYRVTLDLSAHTVTLSPFAFTDTKETLTFAYDRPAQDHLVLTRRNEHNRTVVIRLRRVDPSTYTLVGWQRGWTW